jgi:hypothetical protein
MEPPRDTQLPRGIERAHRAAAFLGRRAVGGHREQSRLRRAETHAVERRRAEEGALRPGDGEPGQAGGGDPEGRRDHRPPAEAIGEAAGR